MSRPIKFGRIEITVDFSRKDESNDCLRTYWITVSELNARELREAAEAMEEHLDAQGKDEVLS